MACREMTKSITYGAGECCGRRNKKKPDPGQKRFGKLECRMYVSLNWHYMINII